MKHNIITLLLFLIFPFAANAQESSIIDLLQDTELTEVTLITDIRQFIKKKNKEEYQSGTVKFENGPLAGQSFEVSLRARGNMRKQVCYIPPLKVKFKKGSFTHRKIKWVNVCKDNTVMEAHLLEEYLLYKIYEVLTDHSYRTRLMRVKYCSPNDPDKVDFERYAFLIEPEKQLAERFNGKPYHPRVMSPSAVSSEQYNLMMAFEYMVANTDWAIENQHNLTLISDRNLNAIVPVPYDFDYTGFVNTAYATPNTYTPIEEVTERYNRGHCMEEESAKRIIKHILSKKDEIIAVINNFDLISEKNRRHKVQFLETSFKEFSNDKIVRNIFCRNCKPYANTK